jgi:hypothetical protein
MNRKYDVTLTTEQRQYLEKLISAGTARARALTRARILLKSDCGAEGPHWSYDQICTALEVSPVTVSATRQAFVQKGLEAALSRKKPEREYKRCLDGEAEAHLIALACGQAPEGHACWSLRLLAQKMVSLQYAESVSHETVRQVLKKRTQALAERAMVHSCRGER